MALDKGNTEITDIRPICVEEPIMGLVNAYVLSLLRTKLEQLAGAGIYQVGLTPDVFLLTQ